MDGAEEHSAAALVIALATARGQAVAEISAHADAIARAWQAGRQRWPGGFGVDDAVAAVAAAWARALGDRDVATIDALHPDLVLAAAALAGDAAAHRELDSAGLVPTGAAMVRRGWPVADVDDVLQIVRVRLLMSPDGGKLRTYRGQSSLRAWLQVVVGRELAARRPVERLASTALEDALTPSGVAVDTAYRDTVRACLRTAIEGLEPRLRTALRMEVVHRASHGAIARVHGVHRTTVVRWCEEARAELGAQLRKRLAAALHLGRDDVESHLRGLGSKLELSMASLLATTPDA